MGRGLHRLTIKFVESNKHKPGMYCDGGGLYLRVAAGGSKQRIFRYVAKDPTHPRGYRLRDMGMGPAEDLSLAQARNEALYNRRVRRRGTDPIAWRMMNRAKEEAARAKMRTLQQCAEEYLQDNISKWADHTLKTVKSDFRRYVYPKLGAMPVQLIETPHILDGVLKPIWHRIPTTASEIRAKIESVLAWATVHRFREGDNPAAWDLIKQVLPAPKDVRPVKNFSALPYQQVPQYVAELRQTTTISARCVELLVFTVVRSDAAAKAKWSEIDFEARIWTIPGERMKRKQRDKAKSFRVPLSKDAIALLERIISWT
jgi:integrase